jgi:Zn-finger nucleic acid-binding protein
MMKCPKCPAAKLNKGLSQEGVVLDYCPICLGIWFDAGEVAKHFAINQDIPPNPTQQQSDSTTIHTCPRCQGTLVEVPYTNGLDLLVDYCSSCAGIWFDNFETERLADWLTTQNNASLLQAVQQVRSTEASSTDKTSTN